MGLENRKKYSEMAMRKALYHLKWFVLETLGVKEPSVKQEVVAPFNPVEFYRQKELAPPICPPVFATGTGRCGTHFFDEVFKANKHYLSTHADTVNPVGDSFHQYCRFHGIDVDLGGMFWARKCLMDMASGEGKQFFEANAVLSLHIRDFHREFNAPIIAIFRSPLGVVPSNKAQGIYSRDYAVNTPELPAGFQYNTMADYHSFGSLIPSGDVFEMWEGLTEAGQVAWRWDFINRAMLEQLESVPESMKKLVRIETFDYDAYLSLGDIMDLKPIPKKEFDAIRERKPGKTGTLRKVQKPLEWSKKEREEVVRLTGDTAQKLGYDIERELAEMSV